MIQRKDLVIQKADKGNTVVIIDRENYLKGMKSLLSDNTILSPLTVNDYTVKDSFTFAKEVINFDHNLFMASLDVGSLFTNIPIDETIKNAVDDLFSSNMY